MGILFDLLQTIFSSFIKARKEKNNLILFVMYTGFILIIISILYFIFGNYFFHENNTHTLDNLEEKIRHRMIDYTVLTLVCIAFIALISPSIYYQLLKIENAEKLLIEQERKVTENPREPKLAWDLARAKLENYLDRNLSQVRSIFYLSAFASTIGFGLIIYGSVMAFQDVKNINASLVVAISGLVANFIAATFLVSYKSTMEQAKEYVNVLERINAVGMSVQIIESIKDSHAQIKEETKAELSKKLIDLYTEKK